MAFTAAQIKNLALQEINHESITNWSDSSNTDIPIINAQYDLAKSVALSMYQWSWAFKYAELIGADNTGTQLTKYKKTCISPPVLYSQRLVTN